ncbi:MAG: c-type cytochrome domain-containing protein [Planctomycetota bacterium]
MFNLQSYTASVATIVAALLATTASGEEVDFNRDIRPILSDICFKCHGPDAVERKAELRLDTPGGLFGGAADSPIVVPNQPDKSELYRRLVSDAPDERMPPPDSKRSLTEAQVEAIRAWIEQGAKWEQHWAFTPPLRTAVPEVELSGWLRNPIDAFVARRRKVNEKGHL